MKILDRESIATRIAFSVHLAQEGLFKSTMKGIREKAKAYTKDQSEQAVNWLTKTLITDLQGKGFAVEADLKMSRYKGSFFINVAKVRVKAKDPPLTEDDNRLSKLVSHLQAKYDKKFKLKKVTKDGIAEFSMR